MSVGPVFYLEEQRQSCSDVQPLCSFACALTPSSTALALRTWGPERRTESGEVLGELLLEGQPSHGPLPFSADSTSVPLSAVLPARVLTFDPLSLVSTASASSPTFLFVSWQTLSRFLKLFHKIVFNIYEFTGRQTWRLNKIVDQEKSSCPLEAVEWLAHLKSN